MVLQEPVLDKRCSGEGPVGISMPIKRKGPCLAGKACQQGKQAVAGLLMGNHMEKAGPTSRYIATSLCLGLIAVWGSENLFWTVPATPFEGLGWAIGWLSYSLIAAAALSVVLWAGLSGWRAAFLGGALLGFGVEGVLVTTMYDAFPAQIVWTPLAWHALVTGLLVLALPRALARFGVAVQVPGFIALGLFGAVWGLYWPNERQEMPGYGTALAYLPGLGLTVVAAQIGLDRLGRLSEVPRTLLLAAPLLLATVWLVRMVMTPALVLLSCPVMVLTTAWIMGRLGKHGPAPGNFEQVPVWRHGLFLIAPVMTALLVVPGWQIVGPVAVNIPIALISGAIGLGLWLWLLREAAMTGRQKPHAIPQRN